jgi:hypothetical protein
MACEWTSRVLVGLVKRVGMSGWCGEQPLKFVFPELFNVACNKDAWVEEHMETPNDLSSLECHVYSACA